MPYRRATRRQFIRSVTALSAATLFARAAVSGFQNQSAGSGLRALRRGTGIFIGPGGTIGWLATRDEAVIVDSQFPGTARECLDGLRQRSIVDRVVLINTHHHGDHTAGNSALRPFAQQIVQHEACARLHARAVQEGRPEARAGLADVTFTEQWSMTVGDERVSAIWYGPAHTGGDAVITFERAGVVHLGDLVFNRIPPFVDRAAGASIRNWIQILERILRQHAGAMFVFGHGRADMVTGTAADVAHFRDYLTAVLEHVQRGIAAGRSLQEIAAVDTLPGFADHMDAVKNYASPNPLFTLAHVVTAAHQELSPP